MKFKTPEMAWHWLLSQIEQHGDLVRTEDGQLTKECLNLMATVEDPRDGWPLPGSNWNLEGLNRYSEQLLSPEIHGFDYTYGNRLREYPDTEGQYVHDQLKYIINRLKDNPTTRRAIAITWIPDYDIYNKHVPCLQSVDFLYRAGRLHETAYFRSWDIKQAAPANMYGLARLLSYVAEKVRVPVGSLTVIAASAHCYEV